MKKNKLPRRSPRGGLIQWKGNFYSRKQFFKAVFASGILLFFPRRGYGLPIPFGFFKKSVSSGTVTYNSGTSWTVPAGVTSATIELYGKGGAGGDYSGGVHAGGGGGGGAYCRKVVAVTPGSTVSFAFGGSATTCSGMSAGNAGNGQPGSLGKDPSAIGGGGGIATGGTINANGSSGGSAFYSGKISGNTDGGNAGGPAGGAGGSGGHAIPGSAPGGGGSGGNPYSGGAGAGGRVIISW